MHRTEFRLRGGRLLAVAAALVWVFAVLFGYYVVHKPVRPANALAIAGTVLNLLIWLLLLAAVTGLGRRILARRLAGATPLEELVLSAGLGLGLLGLLMLGLGLVGGLHRWLIWLLVLGLAASSVTPLRALFRRFRTVPPLRAKTSLERLLAGYTFLILLPTLAFALAPPIAWDSQVYHLTGPKLYIEAGRIVGGVDIPYLGFPALIENLFTAAMLLRGAIVAKLVHFTYALLSLLLVYALADRYLTRRAGWLGMAILAAAPSIMLLASWAYVDLALLFYELAALTLWLRWCEAEDRNRVALLVFSGVLSGLAMGVKYTAVLLPAVLGLLTLWQSRAAGWRRMLGHGLFFGGVTALVAAPWFLKNWALTGNPFYPFFFPGAFWDEFRAWFYDRAGTGLAASAPWRLLIAPWEATVYGREGAEGYAATIGPLFLAAIPLLLLTVRGWTRRQRRFVALLLTVCLPQYLFWLYGVARSALLMQTRLLFPIFGFLALLAGFALDRLGLLDRPEFSLRRVVMAAVSLVLALDLFGRALHFAGWNPLAYLAGWEQADTYLDRYQGDYQQAMRYLNKELPPSSKIYFLWEPRSFYCQRDVRPDAILDGFLHLRYRFGDAAGIDRYLRDEGYSHVLLYKRGMEAIVEAGFDPVTSEDLAVMQELQTHYWSSIARWGDAYVLYELVP